jgi:hypothetical protein
MVYYCHMKNEQTIKAARCLAAHKQGEQLSNEDLRLTIRTIGAILPFLSAAGMEYDLVWKDLLLAQEAMKIISRNRKKGLTGDLE